jgi:hypothetical protein
MFEMKELVRNGKQMMKYVNAEDVSGRSVVSFQQAVSDDGFDPKIPLTVVVTDHDTERETVLVLDYDGMIGLRYFLDQLIGRCHWMFDQNM